MTLMMAAFHSGVPVSLDSELHHLTGMQPLVILLVQLVSCCEMSKCLLSKMPITLTLASTMLSKQTKTSAKAMKIRSKL